MRQEPTLEMDGHDHDDDTSNAQSGKLLALLRGRWHWAVLLGLTFGVAGGYGGYKSKPDLYQATSYIDIKPEVKLGPGQTLEITERYSTYINTQIRRMMESQIIDVAMDTPEFHEAMALRPEELGEITSAEQFARGLEITPPDRDETTSVIVTYTDRDPETARGGLNALMKAYQRVHRDEQAKEDSVDLQTLTQLLQGQRREERELLDERARIIPEEDLPTLSNMLQAKLSALSIRERELESMNLKLGPWLTPTGEPNAQTLQEMSAQDPQMLQLVAQRDALENELRYKREIEQRGENHPMVQQLRRHLAVAERDILELENEWMAGQAQRSIPPEVAVQIAERDGLIDTIAQLRAEIDDLSRKKQAVDDMDRRLLAVRNRITRTEQLLDEHKTTQAAVLASGRTQVTLGPLAGVPTKPYNAAKRIQFAVAGAVAGLCTGFGMVMLIGAMDRRLRHVDDATAGMPQANVLGILPTLPTNLKEPEQAEAAAHCVHHIRTLLQIGGNGRVFSVTSPTAGSGKSSLTSALGLSFAASDTKTLVIDCDLVGAGLSRRLGTVVHQPLDAIIRRHDLLDDEELDRAMTYAAADSEPLDLVLLREGYMDEGEIERAVRLQRDTSLGVLQACTPGRLRSCVAAADAPNLFVLPVGNARPGDAGKLSPGAIRSLIQQAREDFDIVLIDTGPVLGSLEASIAAAEADATVLIVSRGDQKSLVQRAISQLLSVRANLAGVVFNHALESDLAHTSYASIVSQDRRPDRESRRKRLPDAGKSARYGPLGSAVAVYGSDSDDQASSAELSNGHAE